MIVKNESRIIKRLLKSVLPIIDTYCICDTGSTDDTITVIQQTMNEAGISGEVFSEPFQNFGYNRTVALERAARWGTFALLLDADMTLMIEPTFHKQTLLTSGFDTFQIQQRTPGLIYSNTRIVRTGCGIKCVGPTHEYYDLPDGLKTKSLLHDLWIQDIGDGGCKSDKFQRDIHLLTSALESDPTNPRYLFYLGNSYRDIGDYRAAIETYKKRFAAKGWNEEIFMTCLYLGNCYNKLGDGANACYWWLEGYNQRPQRAETLYELCKYYRIEGKHALSYFFWEKGSQIPFPTSDILFVDPRVYSINFLYEYSILAYYLKKPINHRALMRLFSENEFSNSSISNYKFYIQHLKDLPGTIDKDFTEIVTKTVAGRPTDTFRSSSPCILPWSSSGPDGTRYLMNVRYVNYKISSQGAYEFQHADEKITTLNRTLWLSADLRPLADHWFDAVANPQLRYQGVEDVRLFPADGGGLQFVGVMEHPTKGLISVGHGSYDVSTNMLQPTVYESPVGRTCEKNWVFADSYHLIYEWSPLTIAAAEDGRLLRKDTDVPPLFSLLRGSTCGTPVGDNELWFVCHFVEYSNPRHYNHVIVVLDRTTLRFRHHSIPFKFHGDPIEYCLGLVVESDRLLFSYSRWDRSSAVMTVPRAEFERAFMSPSP